LAQSGHKMASCSEPVRFQKHSHTSQPEFVIRVR
jgi:hypothetical protein